MTTSTRNDHITQYHQLLVEPCKNGFWLVWPDGTKYCGPYKTAGAARSELTKMRKL